MNDPEEFIWECDYTPTFATKSLLAHSLIENLGKDPAVAHEMASIAIASGRLKELATPIVDGMITQCRDEIGVACFGTSGQNPVMWERYGGGGAGVCIEIDVPEKVFNDMLYYVTYTERKIIHFDELIGCSLKGASAFPVYSGALLSKPLFWSEEAEVRFLSNQQNISVHISGSSISNLIIGSKVERETVQRILSLVKSLPYSLPIIHQ